MDIKRHLKSALKQLGFDKPRKAQIIPMKTLDAGQDAIVIAATSSGKQVIYETVGLAHSDRLTIEEALNAFEFYNLRGKETRRYTAFYIPIREVDRFTGEAPTAATLGTVTQYDYRYIGG